MIIDNIEDLNTANQLIINPLTMGLNLLLPLDQFTHACIINDKIDFLKQTTESNRTYDEYVADYIDLHGVLDNDPSTYGIVLHPIYRQMVYPFSRKQFFKTFYPNILPSITNLYFNYMKDTGRVMQVGAGVGKCILIKAVNFTEEDFTVIKSLDFPYSSMTQLLVQATNHLAKQEIDIKFLTERNATIEKDLQQQHIYNAQLQNSILNKTMSTWS